ncbi:MAG TPA: LuxR C-terminal-related transcriptional regulator [Thermomicrobiales bacterium]|nr:LuxR C-terminal-related transcriptional regulator [Thermomicrobiales bacterium]
MDQRGAAERTRREIVRLSHAGLDARTLRVEALRRLRQVVPLDSAWFATADPATLLFTSTVVEEIPEHATPAFLANEFFEDDVNKWVHLARARRPVESLYGATRGAPAGSPRYREILAPLGFADELRAVLLTGKSCWGMMCLHRAAGSPAFTAAEAAFLDQLAPHLAEGLRAALLLGNAGAAPGADGPGLVVLADDLSIVATTPAAERWLAELADWPRRAEPPQAIGAVAARLWELERAGEARPELPPRVRMRTRGGQWLVLHASRLAGPGAAGHTAVIIEQARPAEVAPLVLQAYALTDREAQVAQMVLRGLATEEIGAGLYISSLTVQQHLKAVFDKTGVRSRRELVAHVFAQQYAPHLHSGSGLGVDRWFADDPVATHRR